MGLGGQQRAGVGAPEQHGAQHGHQRVKRARRSPLLPAVQQLDGVRAVDLQEVIGGRQDEDDAEDAAGRGKGVRLQPVDAARRHADHAHQREEAEPAEGTAR